MKCTPSQLGAVGALLALTSAACAQSAGGLPSSSVTIYGQIDLSIGKINNGTSSLFMPPPIENGTHGVAVVKTGGPTIFGLRGLEDLGAGLFAGFDLQNRFLADTGTLDAPNSSLFWQGKSLLFLRSTTLGEIFLGRDNFLAFYNATPADPFGFDYSAAALGSSFTMARYTVAGEGGFRPSNQIGYRSPRLGGVALSAATALGEGSGFGRQRNDSMVINYSAGPAYLGIGFDRGAVSSGADRQLVNLTGVYNFGFAKLAASVARKTDDSGATADIRKVTSMTMAATVPVRTGNVKLAVGRIDPDGDNNDSIKLSMGYEHLLSKRTSLKASLASSKTDRLTRATGYEGGILHRF